MFSTNSEEEAQIIHDSLKPDNLATPPMKISSRYYDKKLVVSIEGLTSLDTANATLLDLLESYNLNEQILRKINDYV